MEQSTVEKYLPIIEEYAQVCFKKLNQPTLYEVSDLVNEGIIALCTAVEKFDETRNVSFASYLRLCLMWHFARVVSKSYKKIPAMYQTKKEVTEKQTKQCNCINILSNFKKLTLCQLKHLMFYLEPPEYIVNELLKKPQKQFAVVRNALEMSYSNEWMLRKEIIETLLA